MDSISKWLAPHPRIETRRPGNPDPAGKCVVYWMQRAQRAIDNPALNLAILLGNELRLPVLSIFSLTATYPGGQRRHYRFLTEGLVDAEADAKSRGVELFVRLGGPADVVPAFVAQVSAAILISDQNPIRIGQLWRSQVADRISVPFYLVDADVVVPTSLFPREEFAARTIRPKIHKVWNDYLKPLQSPRAEFAWKGERPDGEKVDPTTLVTSLRVAGAGEVAGYHGGSREAKKRLDHFIKKRLPRYATERNQPTPYMTSELSAHLHFGHIGPITVALAAMASDAPREQIDVFLEELIVRRELAINYVTRNPRYDSLEGCPDWARATLADHAGDPRAFLYSARELEAAETHDAIWNAAQLEMVRTGRMHNYMRMYWAKKILEWTPDAATAFGIALDLNDRYEMDGRDPNGYTGVAWAIGGKHDRPWPSRPIFGTVRYMSADGMRRKFDTEAYIKINGGGGSDELGPLFQGKSE